jgi:polysaccharide pyruvyl transferase WcaK-like protein
MKTLLIGNFGDKNLGDEMILDAALNFYGRKKVIVMTADSEFSQKFCKKSFQTMPPIPTGIRSFFKFVFNKKYRKSILKKRTKINKIVFVGGGLFAIKIRAYFVWWITTVWVKKLFKNIPIYWEYQGIDAPINDVERFFLRSALTGAKSISVRDKNSFKALKKLGILGDCTIKEARVEEELRLSHSTLQIPNKKNILLLNAIVKINKDLWKKIKIFAEQDKLEIVFIAFILKDKKYIPQNFNGRVLFPETKKELIHLFSQAKVVLGERFHSLILGNFFCPQKTFLFRDPYSQKVRNFCKKNKISILKI